MAEIALVVIVFIVVAGAAWIRKIELDRMESERDRWTKEYQILLNRIKPETAQAIPMDWKADELPQPVRMDDDEAYWETTEEFADRAWQEELKQRAEASANQ